ncbi:ribosomal RNA processing protein 1 homolog A isoform X1 [Marmota marmota marmota]|uniref:ribosomal RNA processing protein 1 homolog A isoform X1 n=1 Tax=Marmota marmota marmota TaxID=9994 RepID=UPI002093BED1|nr:ribosomal RNA processing protein 1 homolog A isoform X1 [Marmota marmota marmota]
MGPSRGRRRVPTASGSRPAPAAWCSGTVTRGSTATLSRPRRVFSCSFTHDELLKVWKGLFYCMWMQDKPLLQEELGRTISQLIHAFQTTETQHLFLQTFWQTMNREWAGIDRLRLDKFYMLMRMVLNESLKAVRTRGWEEKQVEQLLELLITEILHPSSQAPNGVKSHFIEIFLEELTKVGAKELTADQNLRFIDPFCKIAACTKDSLVLHNIARGIFETIVEQAPFAIEDLMNEMDAQNGEDEASDGDGESLEGSIRRTDLEKGKGTGDDEDSAGPVLQFDYEAVANRLFEVASRQSTPSQNRKRLYKVIQKLQDLAGGTFPEDDIPEKTYRHLLEGRRERKMRRRSLKSRSKNKRRRTGVTSQQPALSWAPAPELNAQQGKARRRPLVQTWAQGLRGRGAGRGSAPALHVQSLVARAGSRRGGSRGREEEEAVAEEQEMMWPGQDGWPLSLLWLSLSAAEVAEGQEPGPVPWPLSAHDS